MNSLHTPLYLELIAHERLADMQRERERLELLSLVGGQQRPRVSRTRLLIAFVGTQMVRLGARMEAYGAFKMPS